MSVKIKTKISQLAEIGAALNWVIMQKDPTTLKSESGTDYLVLTCIGDIVDKLVKKYQNATRFGLQDNLVQVSLKANEAIALYYVIHGHEHYDFKVHSALGVQVVREVFERIDQAYFV